MLRRVIAVLSVAALAVGGLLIPPAPEAHAGLYNLFPADYDGFPKGHFYSDEALYVTLTSDIKGGIVCVVSAAVTDPSRANCVSNLAWGNAHQYVGMGTLLGYPLAAPRLQPGRWRLLTTPELETVESVPVVKNAVLENMSYSRPTPGTELSEVFEVEACDPCDEADARAELQEWKDTAKTIAPSAAKVQAQKAIEIASKSYKIAAGMYEGAAGGLAGILLGGMAGAGVFAFEVEIPSTDDLAKQLYKELATKTQAMFAGIVADPPDYDYDSIAAPALATVQKTGNPLLDDYFQAMSDAAAYGDASRVANERYQGAVLDGDHQAAYRQAQAAADFTAELVARLRLIELWQNKVASFQLSYSGPELSPGEKNLGAQPYFFDSFADVDDVDAYWADVLSALDDIAANGISDQQRAELKACDPALVGKTGACWVTDELIDAAVESAKDAGFLAYLHSIDPHQTIGQFLQGERPLYAGLITNFADFGTWMAHNAARENRLAGGVTPNGAPTAAFTASKTIGAAPLTVTFTSQSTDPDNDKLSLHWGIAGARHVYDQTTVTHTFTAPGTYWIGLTATDPLGLWNQAVKKIEVYPPDSPGGDNHAPVASFTPTVVDDVGPFEQTFTATSTDPDGDTVTHTWYFGDGTSYPGNSVTKTFPPGYITSVLLVASDGRLSSQASGEVTSRTEAGVDPAANHPPVASFTADPLAGDSPLQVVFTSTSTDEDDGDVLSYWWDFGDGQGDSGKAAIAHTYTVPGSYQARLTVSDGHATDTAMVQVTVTDAPAPLAAGFTVGSGYDAVSALSGARIFDTGVSEFSSTYPVTNLISPNGSWLTAAGVTRDQEVVIELAGGGRDLLDTVVIQGVNSVYGPKVVSVALSAGSNPFGGYRTVVDHATVEKSAAPQELPFAAQQARFLKLTVHENYGGSYIQTTSLTAPTAGRDGGIVSLDAGVPATIVSASSEYNASYPAANALSPDGSYWSTKSGDVTDQSFRVKLGGGGVHTVGSVVLRGSASARSVKHFEIRASMTGAEGSYSTIGSGTLLQNATLQEFPVTLTDANYIEVFAQDNYGDTNYLYLYELRVLTPDGLNLADGAGVGARIVDFSSTYSGYPAANVLTQQANNGWLGAAGAVTNQYVTALLRDGREHTIDHVVITPGSYRPKNVEVQVSGNGIDFTTVAARQLLNLADGQTIAFAPVAARFVRLMLKDGYHGTYLGVQKLRVFAIDRGGAASVPFVDTSSGSPVAWQWNFGDGTTSTDQHPVHAFPGPGTYPIALTVTDADDDTATITRSYTVPGLPALGINAASSTVNEGDYVPLTATTDGNAIVQWDWDLDYAKPTATSNAVTARFPDNGSYDVAVRGYTADWLWTPPVTRTFTVLNVAPTVTAGSRVSGLAGDPITPIASLYDPAGADDPLTCTWDWGDGTAVQTVTGCDTSSARVPHTYALPGVYTATLTADDGDGGRTSGSVTLTALIRATFLQITQASAVGNDLTVSVRLLDTATGVGVSGASLQIAGDVGTAQTGTTDADGFATVTLSGASAATSVNAAFAGTALHSASSLTRVVRAPRADIVFVVDESGSMSGNQAAIIANLQTIARGLGAALDYRLGVVGYAGSDQGSNTFGHVHTALTSDVTEFYRGSKNLTATFGTANGYEGIVVGSGYTVQGNSPDGELIDSGQMNFRPTAASCLVLVSDASASEIPGSTPKTTRSQAEQALASRGTTVFALTAYDQLTKDAYGPGVGLAGQTGGGWWDVADFARNPADVLQALVTQCITKASTPDLSVAVDAPATVDGGSAFIATVTATNTAAIDTPSVTVTATLPSGLTFDAASDGGVFAAGTRTVTWPVIGLLEAGDHVAYTVTAHRDTTGLDPGDYLSTITAAVGYNGSLGAESSTDNNEAGVTVTVRVPEVAQPDPDPTGEAGIGIDLSQLAAPEAGDEFEYPLSVTYTGTATAADVVVLQQVPDRLVIKGIVIPEGWANVNGDALVGPHPDGETPGTWIYLTAGSLDESPEPILVTASLSPLTQAAVTEDAGPLDADPPALATVLASSLGLRACISATVGNGQTGGCDSATLPVKDIVARVTVRLSGGITYLIVSVAVTESLTGLPITLTWTPGVSGDSDIEPVVITGLAPGRNYLVTWPGALFGDGDEPFDGGEVVAAGASVAQWPGWRVVTADDYDESGAMLNPATREPMAGPERADFLRGDLIFDPALAAAAWRAPSTVTFSVNPSIAFTVNYREVVPVPSNPPDPATGPTTPPGAGPTTDAGNAGSSAPATTLPPSSAAGVEVKGAEQSVTAPAASTTVIGAAPLANTGVHGIASLITGGLLLVLMGLALVLREHRRTRRHS